MLNHIRIIIQIGKSDEKSFSIRNRKRSVAKYGWQELSVCLPISSLLANWPPGGGVLEWRRISDFDTQDHHFDDDFDNGDDICQSGALWERCDQESFQYGMEN